MRKYTLGLLLVPACFVYACGGSGDDSATNEDGGSDAGEVDSTVPVKDGSTTTKDATVSTDAAHDTGVTDAGSVTDADASDAADAYDGFDGNYPYPLPDGATAVIQFAGTGHNFNPVTDLEFLDGVQWIPQWGAVIVSDAELNNAGTLYKYTIDAGAPVQITGYTGLNPIGNALYGDAGFFSGSEKGSLYFSSFDGGAPVVYSAGYEGTRFNQPNDVVVRADGLVYVTDPDYSGEQQAGGTAVYLIRPDGGVTAVVPQNAGKPKYNGLAFTPDQKTLYVSVTDTNNILKYTVNADGSLTYVGNFITADGGTTTRNTGVDGLTVDDAGNVYVAVTGGVEIYNAGGAFIGFITLTNRVVSSLAFGGADRRTLFIAANNATEDGLSALYRIYMNVPGGPTK